MDGSSHRLFVALLLAGAAACDATPTGPDAPRPPVIEVVSGEGQHRLLGLPLEAPVRVRVVAADGTPLAAARVRAHVSTPFAIVEPTTGVTDADGVLAFSWRTGAHVGEQRLALSLPDAPDATPLEVTATAISAPVQDLAGGAQVLCGVWSNGSLGCWTPLAAAGIEPTVMRPTDGGTFTELALHLDEGAMSRGCARTTTARLWCFGVEADGHLIDAGTLDGSYPDLRALSTGMDNNTSSPPFCGLSIEGAAWCWGSNVDGVLGDGTLVDRPSPVPVLTPLRFSQVSVGARHACGLALDGAAWCWGANEAGQLGRPPGETSRGGPLPVDPNFRFRSLQVMGPDVSCGLGVGGGLRCWGNKYHLGLGTLVNAVLGTAVTRPTPPRGVLQSVAYAAVDSSIVAVEADGRGSWWGVLPVPTQVLRTDEPRPFDRLLPFAEFTIASSRGLVCGRPAGATTSICIRTGILTGFDFAAPNPALTVIGMPS